MDNNKLGQEQAFPIEQHDGIGKLYEVHHGMSKRFYAACMAMQGLITNFPKERMVNNGFIAFTDHEDLIEQSFEFADELLRQEEL